ncbi:unnamed protein product, partial [Mesorhabditis belari]|uniref:Uncharacterized protein n=1 Tax=Mesorhabditis belari TaxID=2138241 RepID=A0AAF3J1X4_9BILA
MNSDLHLPFPEWVPKEIVAGYRDKGVEGLFHWQHEILNAATETNENVIYAAPTSAGKSLVAELLALYAALHEKKSFFVLPYVAVAKEKLHQLQKIWRRIDLQVAGFMGHQSAERNDWMCAVCTIEKANSLVNRMITEDTVEDLGVIVLDELHMVNEGSRGTTYEFFIAKVLFLREHNSAARIVAMSATLSNTSKIETWLGSSVYQTNFRPVDLIETIAIENDLCDINGDNKIRELPNEFRSFAQDYDRMLGWTVEALCSGNLCLVFCSSKAEVEKVAVEIARIIAGLLPTKSELKSVIDRSALTELKTEMERIGPIDPLLVKTLPRGIGFHHAGLTAEERECLENFFRRGIIRLLVATSTLSSGVNLPANKVIIRAQTRGPTAINSMTYKQMAGRAGRMGHANKVGGTLSSTCIQLDRVFKSAP